MQPFEAHVLKGARSTAPDRRRRLGTMLHTAELVLCQKERQ